MEKIAKLKYEDFFVRGVSKTLDEINREYDLDFTLVDYMRINGSLQFSTIRQRERERERESTAPQSLEFFLKSFEKGSKPFRRILQNAEIERLNISTLNTVATFVDITNTIKPTESILKNCWGEWNKFYYSNKMREFLYKFRNNILGLNSRVCKFVPEIEAECTLCIINKEAMPIQSETFLHVFFNCVYSEKYRNKVENELFPEMRNASNDDKKSFWLFGIMPQMNKPNIFISCIVSTTNYMIWEMKLRKDTVSTVYGLQQAFFIEKDPRSIRDT